MGLNFIEAAMRRRRRGALYKTFWGWLLIVLAFLVILIGAKIAAGKEESKQKSIMSTFKSIAVVIAVISVIVDLIMRKE